MTATTRARGKLGDPCNGQRIIGPAEVPCHLAACQRHTPDTGSCVRIRADARPKLQETLCTRRYDGMSACQPGRPEPLYREAELMISSRPGAVGHAAGSLDDGLQLRRGNLNDLLEGLHFLLKGAPQTGAGQAERAGEVDVTLRLLDQDLGQTSSKVNRRLFPVDGSGQRSIRTEALSTGQPTRFLRCAGWRGRQTSGSA